jgi:hypothetical protein
MFGIIQTKLGNFSIALVKKKIFGITSAKVLIFVA